MVLDKYMERMKAEGPLRKLLFEFKDGSHEEIKRAIKELEEYEGTDIVSAVCRYLDNENEQTREIAVFILKNLGDKKTIAALIDRLKVEKSMVMGYAIAGAVGSMEVGEEQKQQILEILTGRNNAGNIGAGMLLGHIGEETHIPEIMKALGNERKQVRENAAKALEGMAERGIKIDLKEIAQVLKDNIIAHDRKKLRTGMSKREASAYYLQINEGLLDSKTSQRGMLSNGKPQPPKGRKGLVRVQKMVM